MKGVTANGKSGFFDPTNGMPVIESKLSPLGTGARTSITRKGKAVCDKADYYSQSEIPSVGYFNSNDGL